MERSLLAMKDRLRLGSVLGIPLRINYTWLLVFVWVTWSLSARYFPENHPGWSTTLSWILGAATSLLFFGSVLLHELGHSLVAKAQGMSVESITLFIFGGLASISDEPRTPRSEFLMAVAGPAVSLTLGALFGGIYLATKVALPTVAAVCMFLAGINLSLGVFNLLPGFPLDGGRVLRAVLWAWRNDIVWATRWASRAGQALAYLFITIGIVRAVSGNWVNGLWMAMIGLFLDGAARNAYRQLTLRNMLEGYRVADVMKQECHFLPPQLTLDVLVEQYLLGTGQRCYAVGRAGQIGGLLTVHNVQEVPRSKWRDTHVSDVYVPLEELRTVGPDEPLNEALKEMTAEGVNQLPVVDGGMLVGMLTREDLITFIRHLMTFSD